MTFWPETDTPEEDTATNRPTNHVFHHTSQISPKIPPTNYHHLRPKPIRPLSPPLLPWGDPTPLQRSNFFLDIGSPGRRWCGSRELLLPPKFFSQRMHTPESHGWLGFFKTFNRLPFWCFFGPFSGANSGKLPGSSGYFTPFITGSDWRQVWCLERVPKILPKRSFFHKNGEHQQDLSENHCHPSTMDPFDSCRGSNPLVLCEQPVKMLMNLYLEDHPS